MRWIVLLAVLSSAGAALGQDWPGFLGGPARDSTSRETGLLRSWPAGGPKLLWTAARLGEATSTAVVAGGVVYTAGSADGKAVLFAIDPADGRVKWKEAFAGGGCVTPTPSVSGGRIYIQHGGRVYCRDAAGGAALWSVDVMSAVERARGKTDWQDRTRYGKWHGSPLVALGTVYVITGRPDAVVAAFEAETGKLLWTSAGSTEASSRGWSSPILARCGKTDLLIAHTAWDVVGLSAATGEVFWEHRIFGENAGSRAGNSLCNVPVFRDGLLFCTTAYGPVVWTTFRLSAGGRDFARAWNNPAIHPHHEGVVSAGGMLFGTGNVAWDDLAANPDLLVNGRPWKQWLGGRSPVPPKQSGSTRARTVARFTDPESGSTGHTGLVCQDLKTGRVLGIRIEFDRRRGGFKGYMMAVADGMIHAAWSDDFDRVLLVEASPAMAVRGVLPVAWNKDDHGRFPLIHTANGLFSAPVVCNGRLYLRLRDRLLAYDVKAPAGR